MDFFNEWIVKRKKTAQDYMSVVITVMVAIMILYGIVGYWNSYFNAMMYVQTESLLPLQNVLNNILISNEGTLGGGVSDVNAAEQLKYVTIVISSLPLLIIYPFFQKYFEKGVTIGGVKG